MNDILRLALQNQEKARKIIEELQLIPIWKSVGADPHLVGSLRMGLLMKHRDIDMIHILKGSFYDGYFEKMADRIVALLTPETKQLILQLKNDTPESEKIMGVEYYQAVLRDGIRNYADFEKWRIHHPVNGILHWIP